MLVPSKAKNALYTPKMDKETNQLAKALKAAKPRAELKKKLHQRTREYQMVMKTVRETLYGDVLTNRAVSYLDEDLDTLDVYFKTIVKYVKALGNAKVSLTRYISHREGIVAAEVTKFRAKVEAAEKARAIQKREEYEAKLLGLDVLPPREQPSYNKQLLEAELQELTGVKPGNLEYYRLLSAGYGNGLAQNFISPDYDLHYIEELICEAKRMPEVAENLKSSDTRMRCDKNGRWYDATWREYYYRIVLDEFKQLGITKWT